MVESNQSQERSSTKTGLPSVKEKPTPIALTDSDKKALAGILSKVFDLQKQYGKTPAQLANPHYARQVGECGLNG